MALFQISPTHYLDTAHIVDIEFKAATPPGGPPDVLTELTHGMSDRASLSITTKTGEHIQLHDEEAERGWQAFKEVAKWET